MARPREFDIEDALASIMQTFWRLGYQGASVQDLVEATGLRKGSLYAAFGDKQAMYRQALALYDQREVQAAVDALRLRAGDSAADAVGRLLEAPLRAVEERDDRTGCFLCLALMDQPSADRRTAGVLEAARRRMTDAIAAALAASGLGADQRSEAASKIFAIYVGMRAMARAGAAAEELAGVRRSALAELTIEIENTPLRARSQ